MAIRVGPSSGTKYCAQCSFWSGPREVQGNTLVYENNHTGRCNKRAGQGPSAGREVKANFTCSVFDRWNY